MMKNFYVILISIIFMSCNEKQKSDEHLSTPFTTVVKLISAESTGSFDEAKFFLDVDSAYAVFAKDTGKTPEEVWKEIVLFNLSLSKSKKFTNVFPFYKYNIIEKVDGENATIELQPIDFSDKSKSIIYDLKYVNDHWIVKVKSTP